MIRKISIFILAFFCAANVFAQEATAGAGITKAENGTKEIARLREAMQRLDNALMMANTEELKRLLSDKLEMIHSNGMVETKETLLKNIETKRLVYKTIKRAVNKEVSVRDVRMILTDCYLDVTGILDGKDFKVELNTKEDWRLENGDWKLIRRESKNRK